MTSKEAIKTIEAAKAEVEWNYPLDYATTFEMAIKALEKQIPRKPVEVRNEIVCPTCKTLVGSSPYCRYCGQALDWSDITGYNQNLMSASTALSGEIFIAKSEAYKEFAEKVEIALAKAYTLRVCLLDR